MDAQTKNEIVELTKAMLATFTTEYTKHYLIELTQKLKRDAKQRPTGWLLDERPESERDKSDIKTGYLVKEGAVRKSWLKRWFVVRYDYSIDYFVDEAETQKPDPVKKGSINLAGYRVEKDPNSSGLARIKQLAEKMGMDMSSMPGPKEYPPFTIELYHSSRRCYYIQAACEEEYIEWIEMFKVCCQKAKGFKNQDPVHIKAFSKAVRNTRWSLGRWGWFGYGGSEVQVLADLIATEIEYDILGRALCKLPNVPWFIRNVLRNSLVKSIEAMVTSAVGPAWAAMDKTVTEMRPQVEPKIKSEIDPIVKVEMDVQQKIRDAVIGVLEPALKEHVCPHLGKIVTIIRRPITDGFNEATKIWDGKVGAYKGDGTRSSFQQLRTYTKNYYTMQPAKEKISAMYKPIDELHSIFPSFSSYMVCYLIKEEIVDISDRAVYTFEKPLIEATSNGGFADVSNSRQTTLEKYRHDNGVVGLEQQKFVMREITKPSLLKIVNPLCKPLLKPIQSMLPQPMKDFFDIDDMFNTLVDDLINDAAQSVLENTQDEY
eukprot:gene7399-9094_t